MARFPGTEAEIKALVQNIITGLAAGAVDFPAPLFPSADLQAFLTSFVTLCDEQVAALAAALWLTTMKFIPNEITTNGPGVDLSSLPDGLSVTMADPVKDFKYTRNAITLTCGLSQYSQVRLSFEAMEFGDEPHTPPSNPFTGEIDFGPTLLGDIVCEEQDFTIAFWFRTDVNPGSDVKTIFCRGSSSILEPHIRFYVGIDALFCRVGWGELNQFVSLCSGVGMLDGQWRLFAFRRQGQMLSLWVDGVVRQMQTDPNYASGFFSESWPPGTIGQVYQNSDSDWPFEMADLRVYDRTLGDNEIAEL